MAGWFFDGPGGVKDFRDPRHWHDVMAREAAGIVRDLVAGIVDKDAADVTSAEIALHAPTLTYVNPVDEMLTGPGETLNIAPWGAFPRAVQRRAPWNEFDADEADPDGSYRASEVLGEEDHRSGVFVDGDGNRLRLPARHRQDEYLEWVGRRTNGKLTKAIFVAEGYDYYDALFEHDEAQAVDLYRELTEDAAIQADDLRAPKGIYRRLSSGATVTVVEPGKFNPRNQVNISPGIVHLSHRANSLSAEVNLAGVSGILRSKTDGLTLSGNNAEELLCGCAGGNPNRNSDPSISQQAYGLVKAGYRYTLANPVGLYIADVEHHRILTKDGEQLTSDWWTVIRGTGFGNPKDSRVLRLELAPPPGSKLTLEDLTVDGLPVKYVSQLADTLLVHLFVSRWKRADGSAGPSLPCVATCCRKSGTQQLVISDGTCGSGYQLAFPGLVASQPPAALLALQDAQGQGGKSR